MHSIRENISFNAVADTPPSRWWQPGLSKGIAGKITLALAVSVGCSAYAASLTNSWFEDELNRYKMTLKTDTVAPAPVLPKIVVASRPIKHGEELNAKNTKTIDWAADDLPPSAFKTTSMLFTQDGKRYALAAFEPNEPVLSAKITQPGKMASLSAQLTPGKKAITIRVNDVLGVGGLIVPNDHVDLLWTMQPKGDTRTKEPFTELLLPNVRVLALDQRVKENEGRSHVARAITLEVSTRQAQIIALGAQTGQINLALRSHGSDTQNSTARFQRVNLSHLGNSGSLLKDFPMVPVAVSTQKIKFDPRDITASISRPALKPAKRMMRVTITRGLKREDYNVTKSSS